MHEAPPARFCIRCNYNLSGLTERRCPECGRSFDPSDGGNFAIRPLPPGVRILLKTPGGLVLFPAGMAVLLWLASFCMPGRWTTCWVTSWWLWGFVFFLIVVRFFCLQVVAERYIAPSEPKLNYRPWALAAAILIVVLILNSTGIPSRLVFYLSRPALDQAAKSLLSSGGSIGRQWIGLYRFERAAFMSLELLKAPERGGGTFRVGFVFFDSDDDAEDEDIWLVYCPDGKDAYISQEGRPKIIPLGGDWYEVR